MWTPPADGQTSQVGRVQVDVFFFFCCHEDRLAFVGFQAFTSVSSYGTHTWPVDVRELGSA